MLVYSVYRIWQSVWLEYVGKVHLKRVKYTPDVSSLSVLCEVFVSDTEDTMVETDGQDTEGQHFPWQPETVVPSRLWQGGGDASGL